MPLPDFYRSTEEAAGQASTTPLRLWILMQSQRAAQQRAEATEKYRQLMLDLSRQRLAEEQRYHAAEGATRQRALEEHLSEFAAWRKAHPDEPVENYWRERQKFGREPEGELAVFLREHPDATVEDYLRMRQKYGRESMSELAEWRKDHPNEPIENYWREKREILGEAMSEAFMEALHGPRPTATATPSTTSRPITTATPSESTIPRPAATATPFRPAAPAKSAVRAKAVPPLPPTSIVPAGEGKTGSLAAPPRTVNVPGLGPGMWIGATSDGRPLYVFASGKRLALKREALRELNAEP
jgi:hypothetical protein